MRNLRAHGLSIVVPCYIELRDWYHRYFSARAYRRAGAGIVESRGEKMGAGQAMARLMAWHASLGDGDIEWIQETGLALMQAQDAQPPDYGKVPGREDPLTIPRRTESVFRPEVLRGNPGPKPPSGGPGGAGAGAGVDPAGTPAIQLVALQDRRPRDQPAGGDLIPPGDHAPVARG